MSVTPGLRVALATSAHLPGLDDDSRLVVEPLRALGLEAVAVAWDDPSVRWSEFSLCVIRSTWDYHDRRDAYVRWARAVGMACPLWNAPEVVVWNTDKRYLRQFERVGIPIVPTRWLEPGEQVSPDELAGHLGTCDLVVKPCISAGAAGTFRIDAHRAVDAETILDGLRGTHLMVQPYLESIVDVGEVSLIYLGGEYSHTVRKRPKPGDFRVQEEWGGETLAAEPSAEERNLADTVLGRVAPFLAYARVDMVRNSAGDACLSELEAVEPTLYLSHKDGAPARLAEVIRSLPK